jgi:hypothetical protein
VKYFLLQKCVGDYKWLDGMDFNGLALGIDGHVHYGWSAANRRVTLQPRPSENYEDVVIMNGRQFTKKIQVALWCKMNQDAIGWQPYLPEGSILCEAGRFFRFTGVLTLYCETARTVSLQCEEQQNEDGTTSEIFIAAVTGLEDPRAASSWNEEQHSLQVYEILWHLLACHFSETLRKWNIDLALTIVSAIPTRRESERKRRAGRTMQTQGRVLTLVGFLERRTRADCFRLWCRDK